MKTGWVEEYRLKKLIAEKKETPKPFRWERHPAYRESSIDETPIAKEAQRRGLFDAFKDNQNTVLLSATPPAINTDDAVWSDEPFERGMGALPVTKNLYKNIESAEIAHGQKLPGAINPEED